MGSYGGFYKGEKKKPKKDKMAKKSFGDAPTFTMPKIIDRKNKK